MAYPFNKLSSCAYASALLNTSYVSRLTMSLFVPTLIPLLVVPTSVRCICCCSHGLRCRIGLSHICCFCPPTLRFVVALYPTHIISLKRNTIHSAFAVGLFPFTLSKSWATIAAASIQDTIFGTVLQPVPTACRYVCLASWSVLYVIVPTPRIRFIGGSEQDDISSSGWSSP